MTIHQSNEDQTHQNTYRLSCGFERGRANLPEKANPWIFWDHEVTTGSLGTCTRKGDHFFSIIMSFVFTKRWSHFYQIFFGQCDLYPKVTAFLLSGGGLWFKVSSIPARTMMVMIYLLQTAICHYLQIRQKRFITYFVIYWKISKKFFLSFLALFSPSDFIFMHTKCACCTCYIFPF